MGESPRGIPFKVEQSKNNRNVAKYRSGASLSVLNDKRALYKMRDEGNEKTEGSVEVGARMVE
ncbi:unnamed protein product [Meloidogyne enterolobii]|uniref:Uncharacterized protein n=1 Tax=Meloidogyne enterolobii TaxID=390850 RepID=A0ACB0ZGU6_MELEN